jgi:hypothetical protein
VLAALTTCEGIWVPLTAERKSVHCPSLLDLCDITCEDFIQAITAAKESSDDAGWAGGFVGKRWDTMLNEIAPGRSFEVYKYANTNYLCYKRVLSHGRSTRAAPARAAGPAFPIEDVLDWGDVDGEDVPLAFPQLHQDLKSTCKALVKGLGDSGCSGGSQRARLLSGGARWLRGTDPARRASLRSAHGRW